MRQWHTQQSMLKCIQLDVDHFNGFLRSMWAGIALRIHLLIILHQSFEFLLEVYEWLYRKVTLMLKTGVLSFLNKTFFSSALHSSAVSNDQRMS